MLPFAATAPTPIFARSQLNVTSFMRSCKVSVCSRPNALRQKPVVFYIFYGSLSFDLSFLEKNRQRSSSPEKLKVFQKTVSAKNNYQSPSASGPCGSSAHQQFPFGCRSLAHCSESSAFPCALI